MSSTRIGLVAVLLLGIAAQGCSYSGSARSFDPESLKTEPGWVKVDRVEPTRQETREDCGIAAMAMVLRYHDRDVPPEKLAKACPVQPGAGSQAGQMRDFAKSQGLQAFLFHGELPDFNTELSRGHPIIVGLVKQYSSGAVTHYEVVVAVHPERRRIVTLDPAHGWRENTFDGFLQEWQPAARLMLVVFPPGGPAP